MWISDTDGDIVKDSLRRQAIALCDRHGGIGADGVLILHTQKRGDLTPYGLTIINSDGSVAKNCGNGLRCAALSVLKRHREQGNPKDLPEGVDLTVEGAQLTCRYLRSSGTYPLVAVEMGVPTLGDDVTWADAARSAVAKLAVDLQRSDVKSEIGICDIGNPHIVLTGDKFDRNLLLKVGPALQTAPLADGVNVHLVVPQTLSAKDQQRAGQELGFELAELFKVFVWERGAGETMACGSGACAVAALAYETGLIERDQWVAVDMPGGRLYVKHESADDPVVLAGPGQFVYKGTVSI
jgi:diaminopimelate epimerase